MVESISLSIYGAAMTLFLAAVNAKPTPYPPLEAKTGPDSVVSAKSVTIAENDAQWNSIWARHLGVMSSNGGASSNVKPPAVNFDDNEVLVVFGGIYPAGGYELVDSLKTRKAIDVRLRALPVPGTGASNAIVQCNPYLFLVYKRPSVPFEIQFEQSDKNGATKWETVATVGKSTEKSAQPPSTNGSN